MHESEQEQRAESGRSDPNPKPSPKRPNPSTQMQNASGLQKQVISLYRRCLRAASAKPVGVRENQIAYVKEEFRRNAKAVKRSEFKTIELLVRNGEKQLKVLGKPNVISITSSTGS